MKKNNTMKKTIKKKLAECNVYIGQLEEQNRLLSRNLTLATSQREATAEEKFEQRREAYLRPVREMAAYVTGSYEFRHNVVSDSYEYRRKDDPDAAWLPVDERQLNTIMNHVQDDGRVYCLKSLVVQRIRSELALDYHPVRAWLDMVRGTWDGQDRTAELAGRICPGDYCRHMVHLWLRAMVAQWLGRDQEHANAVMLLLVSPRQGLHKSTFLRQLLPPELTAYYTDDFSLTSKGNATRKLTEFALVNIDEFDKLPSQKMPELKTLMQTMSPSFVRAYKGSFNRLPRIASFAGTSNQRALLTDRSGSRRFLILEPKDVIPVGNLDHRQLYAQLLEEVERGDRCYFTKQEEQQMECMNQMYQKLTPLEELISKFYRAPRQDEEGCYLSARQLMTQLMPHKPSLLRTVSETHFARTLGRMGLPQLHRRDGNTWHVVAL